MKLSCCPVVKAGRNKGYTLIELLAAAAVFAIGILAVAGMQISAFQANRSARLQTEAAGLASRKMEELSALAYDDPGLSGGRRTGIGPAGMFDIRWSVKNDSPVEDTKTISVEVSWNDRGESRKAVLNSIKAEISEKDPE